MLKRIMMIPISLAAAGGLPFLALNRDLATRFQAALDEFTVPAEESAAEPLGDSSETIPSPFASDSPLRLASAGDDGRGSGTSLYSSGSSTSGAYGSGSTGNGTSRSGTGGSSTYGGSSDYGGSTSGSSTSGGSTSGGSTSGGSTSGSSRSTTGSGSGSSLSSGSGSSTSGRGGSSSTSGTSGSSGSTATGSGSSGLGGTRTSNGVTTYGSGAAAATGGTSTGGTSGSTTGSTTSSTRSGLGSSTTSGSSSGSSTAGTGFSAPPLATGQEFRNPTPGLGLGLGEERTAGEWPTTPVLGSDYREVFRFDVTPNWVKANWPRVSTGWTEDQLEGYRVPLVTGTQVHDLTGSLTFFFDAEHRVQRLRFIGNTGDASRLVELVTRYFDLELEPTRLAGLYTKRYHGKPVSVLRIAHDSVLRADRPNLQLSIVLEINNPRGSYRLSEAVAELLATDPPTSSR